MCAEEGSIDSISGNEGRIAQAWVDVRGGLRVFSVHSWHSEGWTPRTEALLEAVVKQAKVTKHPGLIARCANVCPESFDKSRFKESRVMWWSRKKRRQADQKAQKVGGSKEPMIMSLRVMNSLRKITDGGGGRLRVDAAQSSVSLLWSRETRRCRNGMSRRCPKRFLAYSGGRLPGSITKEKGREEEEEEEDSRKRQVRNEIAQEVAAGIKKKASAHEDAKPTAQKRTVGQSVKQHGDCSQIENEGEEEDEDWQGEQMEVQWDEDEKLENGPEWKDVPCRQKSCRRYLSWWYMRNKPSDVREEDTKEMIGWRSMSQEEMDQCWKKLAEKIEEEVLDKYKVEGTTEAEAPFWNGVVYEEAGSTEYESGEKIVWQEFSLSSENSTCCVCEARMKIRRMEES